MEPTCWDYGWRQNSHFTYGGDGLRASKTVNGQTTRYLYENDKVVLEVDGQGNESARNVYGTNLLTRTDSGDTYYYMYNGHGDVTALITTDGQIPATYYYDAFGNITEQTVTGNVYQPYKYAGYYFDDETGLYYLNARYYDPKIARFLSEDTYRGDSNDPLSLNFYTYCHNEPIMYIDPTGHYSWNNFYNTGKATSRIQAIDKQIAELGKKYKSTDNSALKQNYHATADRLRIEAAQIKFYDPRTNKSGANYQQTQINNIRNEHGWTYSQTQYFNPNKGKDTNSITKVGTQVITGKPRSGNANPNLIRVGQELKIPGSGSVIKNTSRQNNAQGTGKPAPKAPTVANNRSNDAVKSGATDAAWYGANGAIEQGAKLLGRTVSFQVGNVYSGLTTAFDVTKTWDNKKYTTGQKVTKITIQVVGGGANVAFGTVVGGAAIGAAPETGGASIAGGAAVIGGFSYGVNRAQNWLYDKLGIQ